MAVTIIKEPQGSVLNAYNNSIIEFGVDAGTPVSALLDIDGNEFYLTPNADGNFWFDMKPVVMALINEDMFSDTIEIPDNITYCFEDESLYLEQEISIAVTLDDTSEVTLDRTYTYLKSVIQQIRPIYAQSDLLRVLLPSFDNQKHVSYFEGYPFDVSIYSNAARTVTITNLRTSGTVDVDLVKGINRLFLSNGENDNGGFEGDLPLSLGKNQLEIDINGTDKVYLTVDKKPVGCGPLLKWFNQSGGWSYWRLLEPIKENEKAKSLDTINKDFYNIEEGVSGMAQSGKEAEDSRYGYTGKMDDNERLVVKELFKSPKVYYYANDPLEPFAITDWKEVSVTDGSKTTKKPRSLHHEYTVEIEMPQIYTQTL